MGGVEVKERVVVVMVVAVSVGSNAGRSLLASAAQRREAKLCRQLCNILLEQRGFKVWLVRELDLSRRCLPTRL